MASNASPEATEVRRRGRRRLIGAIALVLLAVVFVPMLLDSEPRKAREAREGPSAAIPPKDSAPPLPTPPAKPAAPATPPAATVTPQAAEAKVVSPAAPKAAKAEPAPTAAPAPAQQEPPKLQGFAVQVGAFRDEAKLKQSRDKLAAAGVVHYTERLEAKAGPLTRLRAGPFATRAEAEAALAKLKSASIEGKVVPLP